MPQDDKTPEPAPEIVAKSNLKNKKKKFERKPLTDKQKIELGKHREKMKKEGMEGKELKSHSMKMMVRVSKGMSVSAAHKDIMKGQ